MKLWIQISTLILTSLFLTNLTLAETTRIAMKDDTPEAYRINRQRAERALDRRERERQRQHEMELAKLKANTEIEVQRLATQAKPTPRPAPRAAQRYERPSYFNGGVFTGFSNPVIGGFGFNPYGNYGQYGYGPSFRRGGFQRGFRRGGFHRGSRRGSNQRFRRGR